MSIERFEHDHGEIHAGIHELRKLIATGIERNAAPITQLLLAMSAIGLPAFAMGGTLPALARSVEGNITAFGGRMVGLYALNVLGATAGALAVPFVLLPWLGAAGAYALAVAGSLLVGAAAWGIGARWPPVEARGRETPSRPVPRGLVALSALSGAATLALQVLWTRAFAKRPTRATLVACWA